MTKVLLDKILLSDLTHFDTLTKDTLMISIRPHILVRYRQRNMQMAMHFLTTLRKEQQNMASKKVILDTSDALDINQPLYEDLPHYSLLISLSSIRDT